MLLEKTEAGDYRYRLAGTAVEARAGVALIGQKIGVSSISAGLAAQWQAGLDSVAGAHAKTFCFAFPDRVSVRHITLMLPLVAENRETEQILVGCFLMGISVRELKPKA